LEDWSKCIVAEPPSQSKVTCNLLSIQMEALPLGSDKTQPDNAGQEYQANIVFEIDLEKVIYTLHANSVFVATRPCLHSTHTVHSRQRPDFSNVWDIAKVKTALDPAMQETPMIINATCTGGEVIARA
jgi:hypothetical protein